MQYTYLLILSLFTTTLTAQNIYVSSDRDTYGGWIVSPAGETIYTIPDGWRPAAYTGPMGEITIWPLLLERRDAENKLYFAFVTQELEWQELAGYLNIDPVNENRFRAMIDYKYFVLLNAKGERMNQDSFLDIRRYYQAEDVAVASIGTSRSDAKYGLIDTLGQWKVRPAFKKLYYLKQDRYLGYDEENNPYLLRAQFTGREWDTLAHFKWTEARMGRLWTFDQTGHSWLRLESGQYRIMNTEGQLVGDTVEAANVRPFVDGIAAIQKGDNWTYVNNKGRLLNTATYAATNDFSGGYGLVADTMNAYLGYLNIDGKWAVEPNYCYATSFRNNWAVVAPISSDNCSGRPNKQSGNLHIPPYIHHIRRVGAYQLIDTTGQIVFADSCLAMYLPTKGTVGLRYTRYRNESAIMIKWVEEDRIWINPDFTLYRWSQL
ncbi:MAG: WG repeat-containing protein, partial [Bacteroidota bacterium]